jgi:ketosteroid isomerase-like protein
MSIKLPEIIQNYVDASNRQDAKAILACFSDDAVLHDEGKEFHGIEMIEDWILKTIEKYKFHFRPLSIRTDEPEAVVTVEVSGSFPGSPVALDYHFTIASDKISSLTIN